jgi:hypothetical protein
LARHFYTEKEACMNTTLRDAEIGNRPKESPIMKRKSIISIVAFSLWTVFTLGSSIWGFIVMMGPNSVTRYSSIRLDVVFSDNIILKLIVMLMIYPGGGALWGWGIARLMNADVKSMVKACALSWSATVFTFLIVVVAPLANAFGGFSKINILPHFRHSLHYNFLLIFVPAIGIITAVNAYVVTGKLGFKEKRKSIGMYAGLAAALGFLTVGLILLFGFGWEVGNPVYRKYGMILILLICSIGGALAGGTALGWVLEKSRIRMYG